jgi:hypothetical protein
MTEQKLTGERSVRWPCHLWGIIANIEELLSKKKEAEFLNLTL